MNVAYASLPACLPHCLADWPATKVCTLIKFVEMAAWRVARDERVVRTVANYLNLCANCTLIAPALTRPVASGEWSVASCVARGTWPTGGNHLNCFNFFKPPGKSHCKLHFGANQILGKHCFPHSPIPLAPTLCCLPATCRCCPVFRSLYFSGREANKSLATIKPHATHALIYSRTHTHTY